MNSEEYRKKLELDILAVMEDKLKKGQMDADHAKAIARMVLDKLHPPLTSFAHDMALFIPIVIQAAFSLISSTSIPSSFLT